MLDAPSSTLVNIKASMATETKAPHRWGLLRMLKLCVISNAASLDRTHLVLKGL